MPGRSVQAILIRFRAQHTRVRTSGLSPRRAGSSREHLKYHPVTAFHTLRPGIVEPLVKNWSLGPEVD